MKDIDGVSYTLENLADEIRGAMDETYNLVYVDYRDELSDEQAAMIVRGDMESVWESVQEWESDATWDSACDIADELANDALRGLEDDDDGSVDALRDDWQGSQERYDIIDAIRERDSSDIIGELVKRSSRVLLRVEVVDEDHAWAFEPVEPTDFLARVGFEATPANLESACEVIANASPEFGVGMVYALAAVDLGDIYALQDDDVVTIVNPHLWLGNPFAGSGYEAGFEGTVTVPRAELRTDKDAFGYGWAEACGGVTVSAYEAELTVVS